MANPLQALRDAVGNAFRAQGDQHVGLLAEFSDPGALTDAVKALRKQGYTRLDTFSPFPIHGMDGAMGLGASKLGYLVIGGGLTGFGLAFLMIWWTSHVDYAISVSNKPLFAWESSIPIMFELTVLFSALGAVGGMIALNALPRPYNPLFYSERFIRASDDGFFLHVQARDGQFSEAATADALFGAGALAVEYVDHEGVRTVGQGGVLPATDGSAGNGAGRVAPPAPHTTGNL